MHALLCLASLSSILVSHHLLDEGCGLSDGKGEECTSSCGIDVPLAHGREAFIEVLQHEPSFHSVVRASPDIFPEPFPSLRNGLE
jgi:hypothetical protein